MISIGYWFMLVGSHSGRKRERAGEGTIVVLLHQLICIRLSISKRPILIVSTLLDTHASQRNMGWVGGVGEQEVVFI